ncbi:uncharacterized protein LOC143023513 [Oratosquilla oratoria]|uniref:uncharacterized protein LOC143023513 n=1 Tax=Oratosquilla oratoria TaxID=337810 RepID=UPI003F75C7DB
MVERFNRTLLQELATCCQESQTSWNQKLPTLLMAYRAAEHKATQYTPVCLMLGRKLHLPVDPMGRPPDEELPNATTSYAIALQERPTEAHHQVRGHLKLVGEAMRRRYDRSSKEPEFKEGMQVWLYNPRRRKGISSKLQSPWEGPYLVEEQVSDVIFRIRRNAYSRPKVVHYGRMWKYHGRGNFS